MIKVDFHTHSIASPDGALTAQNYAAALESNMLHAIAITDHNSIDFALELHAKLGERIIVGEEIMTKDGEIIGLFLTHAISSRLTALETAAAIKEQGGIVYIPHPFETVRKGVSLETLDQIADAVDIVEVQNGRAVFQNYGQQAQDWAKQRGVAMAAGSDAHGKVGWGRTFTVLDDTPTRANVLDLLKNARAESKFPGIIALLYPKYNRLRKKLARVA